ncbi:MAG: hypothetical protein AAFO96_28450 [Bacteroidota bacterium]
MDKEIPFKTKNTKYGLQINSFIPRDKREGEHVMSQFQERELLQVELRSKDFEEVPPVAYLLPNGVAVIERQYSYVFYKTKQDLENALRVDQLVQTEIKQLEKDPYYKRTFTKFPYEEDPKARMFLLKDGTPVPYLQYSSKTYRALIDDFPEVDREQVKWGELIIGNDGKCILFCELEPGSIYRCLLFSRRQDYESYFAYMSLTDARLWQGRNPQGTAFLAQRETLLDTLADTLKLKREALTYDKTGQNALHRALWELIYTDEVTHQLFLPLLMYLGELQIHTYGGEWRFKEVAEIEAVVPYIWFKNEEFDLAQKMYDKILDPDNMGLQPLAACLWNGKNKNWMYK